MSFFRSNPAKYVASSLLGFSIGYNYPKIQNYFNPNGFNQLSQITPVSVPIANTHAHTNILLDANKFITGCKEKGNECSFSMVLLKNQNKNVDKKWVTFFQASDNEEAVKEMKEITDYHLKKYVKPEETKVVKFEDSKKIKKSSF
jgi:hypothetical protein